MTDIKSLVNELLQKHSNSKKTIAPGKFLVEDFGFDSLKMVELMTEVEDHFDIIIPMADATRIKTVGDLYQAVARVIPGHGLAAA